MVQERRCVDLKGFRRKCFFSKERKAKAPKNGHESLRPRGEAGDGDDDEDGAEGGGPHASTQSKAVFFSFCLFVLRIIWKVLFRRKNISYHCLVYFTRCTMWFCPWDGFLLQIERGAVQTQLLCPVCPYKHTVVERYNQTTEIFHNHAHTHTHTHTLAQASMTHHALPK